jgi:lipid-A-disaccharide synthase-like uncharacterized protein
MIVYYLLGFLPAIFFSARFLIQWLVSEKYQRCQIPTIFWHLSIAGNGLLSLHYFLQAQFPFVILQAINGFIAWRNLNLGQKNAWPIKQTLLLFSCLLAAVTLACIAASVSFAKTHHWLDSPMCFLQTSSSFSYTWPLIGLFGNTLFASRFWIQWWLAEKTGKANLSASFWIVSLVGSLISLAYFVQIKDYVSLIYAVLGIVPYARNLWLIYINLKKPAAN